jgi:hypothetical protein
MSRRNREQEPVVNPPATGIPPFVDQWGRDVWDDPWGQYRANPRLTAAAGPVLRSATGLPIVPPATPAATVSPRPVAVAPTHRVTGDARIEADDVRIRATMQYAKGYAKACKELGFEIPAEIQARLRDDLAARRNRVHKRVRRTVATAAALSAGAVGMNAAAAYFTAANGTKAATATAGTIAVTVSATTGTPTRPLYPGGAGDVTLKVDNPNAFPVTLEKVEAAAGNITASGGKGTCNVPTGVTFTDQTSLNQNVPANSTDNAVDLPGAAAMSLTTADGCQGATFTIPVKVTVKKP